MKKKKKGNKKKIRIKFFNIFLFLTFVLIIVGSVYKIANLKITNIYIKNNYYLTDLEVIETAKIKNYPSTFQNSCKKIEKRLLSFFMGSLLNFRFILIIVVSSKI